MNYRMLLARTVFCGLATIGYAYGGVLNPGFETGDFTNWTQFGDTTFTAVTNPNTLPIPCSNTPIGNCAPLFGSYSAFFGNTFLGGITQSVATEPGATYLVEFWLAVGVDGKARHSSEYIVSLGSKTLDVVDPAVATAQYVSFKAVAGAGTTSLLSFGFRDDMDTFGLDNVNVTFSAAPVDGSAVPEPVSLILAGTSLIALAGLSRLTRRKRR